MVSPFAPIGPSYEGLDFIIRGKQHKTCFGDNKNRPGFGRKINQERMEAKVNRTETLGELPAILQGLLNRNKARMAEALKKEV